MNVTKIKMFNSKTQITNVSRDSGMTLKDVKLEHLGTASSLVSKKNWTTIIGGGGDYEQVDQRIETLKVEIEQTDDIYECEEIQKRITRLASGVAIIKVGGSTESDMIEKKHRIEDALEAVKAAQQEGLLPGGGVALINAVKNLKVDFDHQDQELALDIVRDVVREPARQMARNAGASPDIIVQKIEDCEQGFGYDFRQEKIVNMFEAGIIDPAKVTRCALENATSAAGVLLTTNYAIIAK